MELRHLRYFTAVVQWKGYREASRRLHVSQPAISRTITDLEDELGLKLFARTKRAAELTPEGEIFYGEAVQTLARVDRAVQTAKRAAKGEIGQLSIGFLGSATSTFMCWQWVERRNIVRLESTSVWGLSCEWVDVAPFCLVGVSSRARFTLAVGAARQLDTTSKEPW